jgi:hypothetical protein
VYTGAPHLTDETVVLDAFCLQDAEAQRSCSRGTASESNPESRRQRLVLAYGTGWSCLA